MTKDIDFFVDDKPFTTRKPETTLFDVLTLRGVTADRFFLVSSRDGAEYRDPTANVSIRPGDRFTTHKRDDARPAPALHYTVNGEPQTTTRCQLTAEEILRQAGTAASIDTADVASYFLENAEDGRKYENPSDFVDIGNGDKFLAVHVGRTPVA